VRHNDLMRFLDKEQFQIFNKKNRKFFPQSKLHSQNLKVGIIIFIIISLFLLNLSPFSGRIKNFFYSLSEPVQKWLWEKGGGVSDFFEMILRMKRLEQEN